MSEKVLFVDDEPNVLAGFERQLRKRYPLETAAGGQPGLDALAARGPFAVVVSDLRMPGMDGVQFLARVRQEYPGAIRVLLTGYADVRQAIEAVNRGGVFRFLTKPCSTDDLTAAVDAALAQYRLVCAERELLDKTVRGVVQVLGEVLALANPTAFGRALRVQHLIRELAAKVEGVGGWEVDVAAVLSQLGCMAIPEAVLAAAARGAQLPAAEREQLDTHPTVARDMLRRIPRLEGVAEAVANQDTPYSAPGAGKHLPVAARLLKLALDFDTLTSRGVPRPQALGHLKSRAGTYDPELLGVLESIVSADGKPTEREVAVGELAAGMLLAEDLYSDGGVLLLSRGSPITETLRWRLEATAVRGQAPKRLRVLVPAGG